MAPSHANGVKNVLNLPLCAPNPLLLLQSEGDRLKIAHM